MARPSAPGTGSRGLHSPATRPRWEPQADSPAVRTRSGGRLRSWRGLPGFVPGPSGGRAPEPPCRPRPACAVAGQVRFPACMSPPSWGCPLPRCRGRTARAIRHAGQTGQRRARRARPARTGRTGRAGRRGPRPLLPRAPAACPLPRGQAAAVRAALAGRPVCPCRAARACARARDHEPSHASGRSAARGGRRLRVGLTGHPGARQAQRQHDRHGEALEHDGPTRPSWLRLTVSDPPPAGSRNPCAQPSTGAASGVSGMPVERRGPAPGRLGEHQRPAGGGHLGAATLTVPEFTGTTVPPGSTTCTRAVVSRHPPQLERRGLD